MDKIDIIIGQERFEAVLRHEQAPRTCARFRALLPLGGLLVHARWSGEACWLPLGALDLELPPENATCNPQAGEILFYPGGVSETEILVPYGAASFGSKAGPLAGNAFLQLCNGLDRLAALGKDILYGGARPIRFEEPA